VDDGDRFPIGLVYAVLVLLGAALGILGAFLVPLRLPGGIEGLADVLALVGNVVVGAAAAWGARALPAAAMPGIGWLVAVLVTLSVARPTDEVIIPGSLGSDPGIGTVGMLYLFAGAIGGVLAVVVAARFTRQAGPPTP
jgi:hypothetical protein